MIIPIWLAIIAIIIIAFVAWKLLKFALWILLIIVLIAISLIGLDLLLGFIFSNTISIPCSESNKTILIFSA